MDRPAMAAAECAARLRGRRQAQSFTAAANALLISQSALSRHVIALEKLIGVQLFERKPHALVLTKAGQHLLPAVMKSFDRLEYASTTSATTVRPRCARCACRCRRASRCISRCRSCAIFGARRRVEIDLVSPYGVGPPLSDVDVAVVYSKPTVTDMVRDLLWPVRLSLLCVPSIAARFSGKSLQGGHRRQRAAARAHRRSAAPPSVVAIRAPSQLHAVNVERGLVFDTAMLAVQYALSGEGSRSSTPTCSARRFAPGGWSALRCEPRRRLRLLLDHASRKDWATRRSRCSGRG
jgi:DNA-binding transcriptional LysR family regulator